MTTIKITEELNRKIDQIKQPGKTPWFIINEVFVVGVYETRTQARKAKTDLELPGKISKYLEEVIGEVKFEIIKPAPTIQVPKAEKVASKKIEIVHESIVERPCKMVMQIADEMLITHPDAKRKDILAACVDRGIAYYTARTQYQSWLQVRKEMADREAAQTTKK